MLVVGVINFVLIALVLFLIVRTYNRFRSQDTPTAPPGPTEVELLTEIRDSLRNR